CTNAVRLATQKAKEVFDRVVMDNIEYKDAICLGCDTIVALDGRIFGKPKTADEAFKMFYSLCGKTHEVITGICLIPFIKSSKDQIAKTQEKSITQHAFFVTSLVTFSPYNSDIIEPYIASKAPFDKAGGYGLQDTALASLIKKVTGDRDNVIGFPTKIIRKALKKMCKS
ncbi:MAG: Maf family protein, partial [Firmicutes bacterium]|nr:Maf family protein [Bacillota bacterium]